MDPKALSALDPKMKETYDRVMGTTVTPKPASPPSGPIPPAVGQPIIPAAPSDPITPLTHPTIPLTTPTAPLDSMSTPPVHQPMPNTPLETNSLPATPISSATILASPLAQPKPLGTNPLPPLNAPQTSATTPHPLTMPNPSVPLRTPMTSYQASPNVQTPIHPAMEEKKGSAGKVILFTILGLIFFAIYGVFWLKFLNFPLPF